MDLEDFVRLLEAWELYDQVQKYRDSKWKYIVFVEKNIGCGEQYEQDFIEWCKDNCKKEYSVYNGCTVIFEDKNDATSFKLRWV